MDNKKIHGMLLIAVSLLAMLFIPLLSQDSLNPEEVTWTRNSSCLDAFLADPMTYCLSWREWMIRIIGHWFTATSRESVL